MTSSRQRADEWAVVLAAADISSWTRHRLDGWALIVAPTEATAALDALDEYDRENSSAPIVVGDGVTRSRHATVIGAAVALLLIGFFAVTGSRAPRSPWFERGGADAERIMAGQWWRTVTALTLHADAVHVLGNAVAAALLITAVCRALGPGVGLWLLLLAGAGGNLLTAAAHGVHHTSVGASTAIFGAIGVLAALRIMTSRRVGSRPGKSWTAVAASLALLALLGAGPNADLLAHLFGLLVGAGLGLIAGLTIRSMRPPSIQWPLVVGAGAAVYVAWHMAF